jgi:hypothetical protein
VDERSDSAHAAGWYPDPLHRFEFRWFNGDRWTADVSVDGRRLVDHAAFAEKPTEQFGGRGAPVRIAPEPGAPPRTLAILAFVFGLGGLLIAWTPFLFVVGALGACAAGVLGSIALGRIGRGQARGRGLAIAGMVAGVAALGLCVVGFKLTGMVVREFDEYIDPGPNDAAVTACTADSLQVAIDGTIENLDDRIHDYVVVVEVGDAAGDRATSYIHVDDVAVGEQRRWSHHALVRGLDDDSLRCDLIGVNGPYPFGLVEH